MTSLVANDCLKWSLPNVKAGTKLADEWHRQRTETIDLWGCDFAWHQEFFQAFLERSQQNGCLEEVCKVNWRFPSESGNWGKPLRERVEEWTKSFMAKVVDKPNEV